MYPAVATANVKMISLNLGKYICKFFSKICPVHFYFSILIREKDFNFFRSDVSKYANILVWYTIDNLEEIF